MTPLIQTEDLVKTFTVGRRKLTALQGVSLSIFPGETMGLVGESGCGKSTLGRTLLRLYEPTSGRILFKGLDISKMGPRQMKGVRRQMQMIFQDPFASLNPRMTVGDIISEPLDVHQIGTTEERQKCVAELLDLVNLPKTCAGRFPHEFSGGQRQRIGIARALALHPEFIVCDEPISALDVSIQAQIANLLLSLQKELNLTYLFIAHDLAMVKVLAKVLAVMYLGEFVETGSVEEIYADPRHPYTQILLASVPLHDPVEERKRVQIFLHGEPPSPLDPPKGCPFCTRCPKAKSICFEQKPELQDVKRSQLDGRLPQEAVFHKAACFFAGRETAAEADLQNQTRQAASEKIFLAR
jgi:oligopeptide/dipeptide ABC transporter ATP-binding protein